MTTTTLVLSVIFSLLIMYTPLLICIVRKPEWILKVFLLNTLFVVVGFKTDIDMTHFSLPVMLYILSYIFLIVEVDKKPNSIE